MALIKSYLICCAAIITISMGADNWIELVRPRSPRDIATVQGKVQFWGAEWSESSTSGSAAGQKTAFDWVTLFDRPRLTLVPGCTLSFEEHVFTFNSRFEEADAWTYLDSSSSSSSTTEVSQTRTAVNQEIKRLSTEHLHQTRFTEYLVWKAGCPAGLSGLVPKKFQKISHQICSITITVPKYTATKEEASYYIPGRKRDAICSATPPKPAVFEPPDTAAIVDGLSKAHGARGGGPGKSWMNTYWDRFSAFLDNPDNNVQEISHFLKPMIILRRQWNERKSRFIDYDPITPTDAKKRMTEIYDGSISPDIARADSFPLNVGAATRLELTKWATKTYPWCNQYGELHIVPTGTEWTNAITSTLLLLKRNPLIIQRWRNSDAYKNWLDTPHGEQYRKWKFSHDREKADSKLIRKKKTATASASASSTTATHSTKVASQKGASTDIPPPPRLPPPPYAEKYKVGSALIRQTGPSTYKPPPPEPKHETGLLAFMSGGISKKSKALESKALKSKALESYYNNIYNDRGYYGYDGFDERYSENDVSAAYLRGYVNGLLSRLNQRN